MCRLLITMAEETFDILILFIIHIQKTWQVIYKIWVRISIERERA